MPQRAWTRLAVRLVGAVFGLVVLAGATVGSIAWLSLPAHKGTLDVQGLSAPVEIRRDDFGIPYIEAQSEADGYFALGFVHAQDRLWQLEMRRRIGAGRLAEVIGEAGLGADRFMRLLRFYDHAALDFDAMSDEAKALISAYTKGINAYLAQPLNVLPPEFWLLWHRPEPWADTDSVVWTKLMAYDLAGRWRRDLVRARLVQKLGPEVLDDLFPAYPRTAPHSLAALTDALAPLDLKRLAATLDAFLPPPPPPGHGSNAWVLSGSRTATGAPLLANDPHLSLSLPGVWYLAGMRTPQIEVVGATLPGMPVFVLGRTDRTAWGMTNTGSDVQDLVIERFADGDASATQIPGGTAPLDIQTSTILCAGCDDETFASRWSVNGPLISDVIASARGIGGGAALALHWTALDGRDPTLEAGFRLPHATDWASFREAVRPFRNPQQNIFYADREGQIGLIAAGEVPLRNGFDGMLPVRGWQRRPIWNGTIPFDQLPKAVDPESGVLVNANNPVAAPDYPFELGGDWSEPYRAERIEALLTTDRPATADEMHSLQLDAQSGLAHALLPLMQAAEPQTETGQAWLDRLKAWDRRAGSDSTEATVFATWYNEFQTLLYADELGDLFDAYRRNGPDADSITRILTEKHSWCDDVRTAALETCPVTLGLALDEATERLNAALGPNEEAWAWGRQHPVQLENDFWMALGPLGTWFGRSLQGVGDGTAVNALSYNSATSPPLFPSRHGPSYRQTVDLAEPEASRFVASTGQVGHPLSDHYADLTELWRQGRTVPMAPPKGEASLLVLQP